MDASKANVLMKEVNSVLRCHPSMLWLSVTQWRILERTMFLAFLHGTNSENGAIYSRPGQTDIAEYAGVHRVTVSRNASRLKSRGILKITQRRPVNGQYQTNLYRLGSWLWIIAGNVIRRFIRTFNRVTLPLHKRSEIRRNTILKKEIRSKTAFNELKLRDIEANLFIKEFYDRRPELK